MVEFVILCWVAIIVLALASDKIGQWWRASQQKGEAEGNRKRFEDHPEQF